MQRATGPRLESFLWRGDEPLAAGALELASGAAALDGVTGHYALHARGADGVHRLARDRLGVNKLFFAIGPDGEVDSSNFLFDLIASGHTASAVWSVPCGHFLEIDPARRTLRAERAAPLPFDDAATIDAREIGAHGRRLRQAFERTFARIRRAVAGRPLYVTLSGGLDSSTVAVLTRELVGEFTAISFAIQPPGGDAPRSDDLRTAARLAAELGVRVEPVVVPADEVVARLDEVLVYGQDWRDFNVHCGLVNACLARSIAAHAPAGTRPIVLTGDTMNELVADYQTETYQGHDFYRLPRLGAARLRRSLVAGLDAGDREVGLFGHHGVATLQPFALSADALAALPAALVENRRAKQAIMREVMGDAIPEYVYERPKTRAQSASADLEGGTLALLSARGVDAEWLARRFAELFSIERAALGQLIRAGCYRSTSEYPRTARGPATPEAREPA
jgi:asparagine synthetase B (glutamine-hydrolysing)